MGPNGTQLEPVGSLFHLPGTGEKVRFVLKNDFFEIFVPYLYLKNIIIK